LGNAGFLNSNEFGDEPMKEVDIKQRVGNKLPTLLAALLVQDFA
jgi:hypothetical protein